ncbi:hypothetical protein [Mesorhizobium sangaii]|uniref:Uncharacterized protein n=1 Tax=Mesorhizobium sangaii TaxID=505389 RepID=A0A841PN18_9HYPH|nr:hypothetical protein [Mesorhizobium sangaii]MBB6411552.1 hypothetical protein [Mesorhizobium sangaii]
MPTDSGAYPALTVAELADPQRAISAAIELYGDQAKTAAACCALEAHFAGREATTASGLASSRSWTREKRKPATEEEIDAR